MRACVLEHMLGYRLYLVSDFTDRLSPALDLDVKDEETAIQWADEVRCRRRAELWNGNRIVRDWHHHEDGPKEL